MRVGITRVLLIAAACLVSLVGCETTSQLSDPLAPGADPTTATVSETTGTVPGPKSPNGSPSEILGNDPNDELSMAKAYYRQGGYGLAEKYFRKAVELHPRDAEAWVGLAASYDRLRRFDLADRAYTAAIKLIGLTPEILNNQGFSYMLRGDYRRARAALLSAKAKSPDNPYIKANLELLNESQRKAKGIN
jgi:tetratricopeptide (TPR) repeat protein